MGYGKHLQGESTHIEYHLESLFYYHQEKPCRYAHNTMICQNDESSCKGNRCIGYTQCSDWMPVHGTRREENQAKKAHKKKKPSNSEKTKQGNMTGNSERSKAGGGFCIGDDPKLQEVFSTFKKANPDNQT